MPASVSLRSDFDARQLRKLASLCKNARQSRRLLSLAAVYDGMTRAEAAKIGGMDRQTLRDWAHRFNDEGPDGLTNRKGAGRVRYLNDNQMRALGEIVETGPDPSVERVSGSHQTAPNCGDWCCAACITARIRDTRWKPRCP